MRKYLIVALLLSYCTMVYAKKTNLPDSYNYTRGVEAYQNNNKEEALEYLYKDIQENPKNGYAYVLIASIYGSKGEFGYALTNADKAVRFIPKKDKVYYPFALRVRAQIYSDLKQEDLALQDYSEIIKEYPDYTDAYEKRAQLYYKQEKYDLADKDYRKLINLDQGNAMGYMGLGRIANVQERYNDAIEQFDYVIKLYPEYASGYSFRAESYLKLKKYDEAIDDIVKSLDLSYNDKAFYLMHQVSDSAQIKIVSKLKIQANKNPNEAFWPYCLGVIYEDNDNYVKAIEYYKQAYSKDQSPDIIGRLAKCYDDLGNYELALEYINQAIASDSTDYLYIGLKANILDNAGRSKDAIAEMDKYINLYPENYYGYYSRGWMKHFSGDIDDAIEDYSMAITLNQDDAYIYFLRGVLYRLKGDTALANEDFQQVIKLDTVLENIQAAQYAYYYLGDKEKAIAVQDSILSKTDKDGGNHYNAACLYSVMGDVDKSIAYLREALELGYCHFAHIKRDMDLDNVRDLEEFKALLNEYESKHQENMDMSDADNGTFVEMTTEIPITKEASDVFKVKCSINNLPLHFIFDTGASDICLSAVEANFMLKNGYLASKDIEGKAYYQIANGELSEGTIVNLRDVEFGGLHLSNIKASIVKNQKAPLLLGQSVLQKLGKIEIDNDNQMLKVTYKKQVE